MAAVDDQRSAFKFFCDRLDSQEPFTKQDLAEVTEWSDSSLNTYWSKQFKPFVRDCGNGHYRVTEAFRPFATWGRFQQHVTQVRRVTSRDYARAEFDNVLIYEFFMPLSNEAALRGTLDALFFKDTVLPKLRSCGLTTLNQQMPKLNGEQDDAYFDRICDWISKRFVGYSISHVNGRFRSEQLSTREEAARIEGRRRYLIDETTAVTRFIFPCTKEDVDLVRWFFNTLFVESVIDVVNGEDEIWMVESGLRNRLHTWRVGTAEQ